VLYSDVIEILVHFSFERRRIKPFIVDYLLVRIDT